MKGRTILKRTTFRCHLDSIFKFKMLADKQAHLMAVAFKLLNATRK